MFVFMLCPHSTTPLFPLHIYLSNKGNADDKVDKKMNKIQQQMKELGVFIPIFSTDSDTHYRDEFNKQFDYITRSFVSDPNFYDFRIPQKILSNDFSHLLKRGRSRLVKKKRLFVSKNDQIRFEKNKKGVNVMSIEILKSLDEDLTDCYFRCSSHDSMDDFYPNAIFNGKSLKNALKNKFWAGVLYLLPLTCMNKILRDKNANRKQRAIWAYTGIFVMFYYWSSIKLELTNSKKERKKKFRFAFLY